MYRLSGPIIWLFVPIIVVGVIICSITPNYFGETRTLTLVSILIGELGLCFIPVLALYPKATPIQAGTLAAIYLITTFIICFASWAINSLGWPGSYSFLIKDGDFHVNTYSLFISNFVSLASLVMNFKLVYDEELTKEIHSKSREEKHKRPGFIGFKKNLFNRPRFQEPKKTFSSPQGTKELKSQKVKLEGGFDEEFEKSFEFEPEIELAKEGLPEESSGKLFSETQEEEKPAESDFFTLEENEPKKEIFTRLSEKERDKEDELIKEAFKEFTAKEDTPSIEKPKEAPISPLQPSDIKKDLEAIFEQYSSLNAVKKITADKSSKISQKKKELDAKIRKPYDVSKEKTPVSVNIDDEDIHEASFRQITEEEKIKEIKDELRREIEEELREELNKEIIETKQESKEEIIQDYKEGENEKEEINIFREKLTTLNKEPEIFGTLFLNQNGNKIIENWQGGKQILQDETDKKIAQLFNSVNSQINKTNQGSLYHLLLESQNGTLVMANLEKKILTLCTKGTGEAFSGQILRTLSEFEEV